MRYIAILLISGLFGFLFSLYIHKSQMPQESDKVMQTFHSPATFVKQLSGDPDAGKKIFKEFCASCHAPDPIIDVHAPRVGDKHVWEPLKKAGIDALLKITVQGAGAMPARGGCFECSDAQLREAIEYMVMGSAT